MSLDESDTLRPALQILQEPEAVGLPLPEYKTSGSAGLDLHAAIAADSPVVLAPGRRSLISTGIRVAIPDGFEGQVRPRSGLALAHGIGMVNAPGTVDSDYRGVINVLLINLGDAPYTVHRGDRIAQMVISPILRVTPIRSQTLNLTSRGDGGFGSTGIRDA